MITATISLASDNITATKIGAENATITWDTNFGSNSTVEYGTTTGYGLSISDGEIVTSHLIRLAPLTSHTIYHFRILSKTKSGVSINSIDKTFTTTYPAGTTVTTKTAGTAITGVTTETVAGAQKVTVNKSTTPGTTTVSGNAVTVTNPGNGWSSLKYTGTTVVDDGKDISIDGIQDVVMESDPVTADLGGTIGAVSAKIEVPLKKLVSDVTVEQKIIQGATTSVANAFQLAATSSNLDVKSVAYTVEFTNTETLNANLGSAGATLNLGVDHAWVEENGGRDEIRILRFGDDGVKEVLSTTFTGSSGTTDYFRGTSPNGLSVFGMTAVASTGGSGGNGGGGTGGGSSSTQTGWSSGGSDSDSGGPSTVQQAAVPVVEQIIQQILAPFEETEEGGQTTTTQSITVDGLTATTGPAGELVVRLDTVLAEKAGASLSIKGNVITISQPGFTLTLITVNTPVREGGVVFGTVRSVTLRTAPVSAQTRSGPVSVSFETPLATIPENGAITFTLSETADPAMMNAFQSAALANNQQVEACAFSVVVQKSNLVTAGTATVIMTVPPEWVADHGGIPSLGIARIADDGTYSILVSGYTGTDDAGNIAIRATSPEGLSAFGLISLKNQTGTAPVSPPQQPAGGIGISPADNIVPLIVLFTVLLTIGISIILYEVRSDNRKRNNRKNR